MAASRRSGCDHPEKQVEWLKEMFLDEEMQYIEKLIESQCIHFILPWKAWLKISMKHYGNISYDICTH